MRRAFTRCSASARAIASPSSNLFANRALRLNRIVRTSQPSVLSVRCIHQSSALRQEAAAAQAASHDISVDSPVTKFDELAQRKIVHENVVSAITRGMGIETMTEVQSKTINEALKGTDMIAQAKTGTGKTLAFLVPVLQNIINVDPELARGSFRRGGPRTTADDIRAIIISPTRELAEQIAHEARKLVRNTGVIVQTAVGGTQKREGLRNIQKQGCHILVGTPGRLKDILSDPYTRVEAPDLSAFVLDEADRLLDQGFWPEIQEIQRLLPTPAEKDRQTLMFSATVPREVVSIVRSTLKPGFQFVKCVRDDEEPTHERIPQRIVTTNGFENAIPTLTELCDREIQKGQQPGNRPFKAIVYFGATAEVSLATSALLKLPILGQDNNADAFGSRHSHPWAKTRIIEIHARLSQGQRTAAAAAFKNAESAILMSTDVTARGMDFPNVTHVIQMGLPSSKEQYIHRIGRTGRAGKEGEGWLIINKLEEQEARYRLGSLPLKRDSELQIPTMDLTKEAQVKPEVGRILSMCQQSLRRIGALDKIKAYKAMLGIYQWLGRKADLMKGLNDLSRVGWGMKTPPAIGPALAQRLGLMRVPGVNIGHNPEEDEEMSGGRGGAGGRGGFGGGREDRFGGRDGGRGGFGGDRFDRGGRNDRFGGGRGGFGSGRGGFGGGRGMGRDNSGGDPFAS